MYLTKNQEKILAGVCGEGKQKAMKILTALGDIYDADRMIEITSAHVSGVSYKTIGDAGLEFLNDFAADENVKISVKSTLNPCGMDLKNWKRQGIPTVFAEKQFEIMIAFSKMGFEETYTCVPYLSGNCPEFGDHIAWGESSAICFANSMIGARTNREGGPGVLAAAMLGITPNFGFHLPENRVANLRINVTAKVKSIYDHSALGFLIGKKIGAEIPYFKGIKPDTDRAKALSAALATGSIAMFQIENVTPENNYEISDKITIDDKDLDEFKNNFNKGDYDLIATGCPHCSLDEIKDAAKLLEGKKINKKFWVCTSRKIKAQADSAGYTKIIEDSGAELVCDTCMVVTPVEEIAESVATNSGKATYYLPNLCKVKTVFKNLDELI